MNAEEYADKHAKIVAEAANLRAAIDAYNDKISDLQATTRLERERLYARLLALRAAGADFPGRDGGCDLRQLLFPWEEGRQGFSFARMPAVGMQIPVDGGGDVD